MKKLLACLIISGLFATGCGSPTTSAKKTGGTTASGTETKMEKKIEPRDSMPPAKDTTSPSTSPPAKDTTVPKTEEKKTEEKKTDGGKTEEKKTEEKKKEEK